MQSLILSGDLLLSIPIALLAGFISFASPCVLPLVPGYLGYVGGLNRPGVRPGTGGGSAARSGSGRLVLGAALFVLGFSAIFVLGGYVFGSLGLFVHGPGRDLLLRVLGVVVILMGVVFIGGLGPLQRLVKTDWQPRAGLVGAPLLGAVFAIGWSPCIGPTLSLIDSLALTSGSAWQGTLLAACYSLGLGIPFLIIALGLGWATRGLTFLKRHIRAINVIGGVLLIVIGVLMVSGVWLLFIQNLQSAVNGFVPAV